MSRTGLQEFERSGREFDGIPAGEYSIGLDPHEAAHAAAAWAGLAKAEFFHNATPMHKVRVGPTGIARRPVTAAEFGAFVDGTGFVTQAEREGWAWTWDEGWVKRDKLSWRAPFGNDLDVRCRSNAHRLPALQLSWNDADAYCAWRAVREGVAVRLPGEAEFEAWMGLSGVPSMTEIVPREVAWPPTVEEFLDLLMGASDGPYGNRNQGLIWEWTADWFDAYPGGPGNREFGTTYRVLRGGSAMSHAVQRGREYRFRRCPTARSPFYGFRVAVEFLE